MQSSKKYNIIRIGNFSNFVFNKNCVWNLPFVQILIDYDHIAQKLGID